ncbi:MAG: hypothetical protein ABN478_06715 [Mixta sp.]
MLFTALFNARATVSRDVIKCLCQQQAVASVKYPSQQQIVASVNAYDSAGHCCTLQYTHQHDTVASAFNMLFHAKPSAAFLKARYANPCALLAAAR